MKCMRSWSDSEGSGKESPVSTAPSRVSMLAVFRMDSGRWGKEGRVGQGGKGGAGWGRKEGKGGAGRGRRERKGQGGMGRNGEGEWDKLRTFAQFKRQHVSLMKLTSFCPSTGDPVADPRPEPAHTDNTHTYVHTNGAQSTQQ